jgi:hypothetical protein
LIEAVQQPVQVIGCAGDHQDGSLQHHVARPCQ